MAVVQKPECRNRWKAYLATIPLISPLALTYEHMEQAFYGGFAAGLDVAAELVQRLVPDPPKRPVQ